MMKQNSIFQEIRDIKENFKKYAQKGVENHWLTKEESDELLKRIEEDKLTIGVIGQMKCGKSTFLNALIFKDEILPSATTPMTASLSVITYGETKQMEAEFYTKSEWDELKNYASLNENDYESDTNQMSKIKAAKEIISKSVKIASEIDRLLGTTKKDAFENLIEYVGADGKYISITKSVKIHYPLEDLKGVEIVDTPGFNDPVVSREERTKDFLKKADVVVMLLYAGRAFDSTDKDIIFNKVRTIGVGKLVIGVNKYDINYANGETNEEMIEYVKEQLLKASEEHYNSSISELVQEQDPLLLSANMALMSQMDFQKIASDESLKFYYNEALSNFEISSQKEMYEKSLMPKFEEAIREIIYKSKNEILIKKPINSIKQKGDNKKNDLNTNITELSNTIKILEMPNEEREESVRNVKKAEKRIRREVDNLTIFFNDDIKKICKNLKYDIEDLVDNSKKRIIKAIENKSRNLKNEVENILSGMIREFDRKLDRFNERMVTIKDKHINNFFIETEEFGRLFLEDFDIEDFIVNSRKKMIDFEFKKIKIWDFNTQINEENYLEFISCFSNKIGLGENILNVITWGAFGDHCKNIDMDLINSTFREFNFSDFYNIIEDDLNRLSGRVVNICFTEYIDPIQENLNKTKEEVDKASLDLDNKKQELQNKEQELQTLESQISEMSSLEKTIFN